MIHQSWLNGFRIFVVLSLFGLSGGTALALQDGLKGSQDEEFPGLIEDGQYESPQFGVDITWEDSWTVGDLSDPNVDHAIGGNFDSPVASDQAQGDIVFLVDTASETSVLSLAFSPTAGPLDTDTVLNTMGDPTFMENNLFLDRNAEILLLDSNDESVAILARDTAPNDEHIVYFSMVTDPGRKDYNFWVGLDMYDADEYENILTSIDEDIDVQRNEIFDVFGPDEILDAIENGSATPTEEPTEEATEQATEEPTEEATEEPTESATEEATEPATEEPTESATEEPTAESTEDVIIPPFQETQTAVASPDATETATEQATPSGTPQADNPGLVADGEYMSPQHDVPVSWTDAWTLDPDTAQPVQSFPETGVDSLYLTDSATQGAIVYVTIENATAPFNADDILAAVSEQSYIETVLKLSPDSEIVLSETHPDSVAVMFLDTSGDTPFVSILEAHSVDDDTIVFIELRAEASVITADLLDSAEDDIQVNGEDALDVLSATDILAELP